MNLKNKDNNFLILIVLLVALEAFLFFTGHAKLNKEYKIEQKKNAEVQALFNNLPIIAKSISVFDNTLNKKVYGKNDEELLSIASLAKIMTVIVALKEHQIDEELTISESSVKENGDSGLLADEKWKVGDLAKLTLISSANDGAHALSNGDINFMEKMNNTGQEIGLENTMFFNSTGLDIDDGFAGAYSTAKDVNLLASYALKTYSEIFKTTIIPEIELKSESGFIHKVKNTNIILNKIPNIMFSKTGLTTLAGGNLVVIFKDKNDHEIVIAVLGSTEQGRFSDMEKLVEVSYNLEDVSR